MASALTVAPHRWSGRSRGLTATNIRSYCNVWWRPVALIRGGEYGSVDGDGALSQDCVARLLRSHEELSQDWSDVEGLLQRHGRHLLRADYQAADDYMEIRGGVVQLDKEVVLNRAAEAHSDKPGTGAALSRGDRFGAGHLIERECITPEQAADVLRRVSQHLNENHNTAQNLADTSERPRHRPPPLPDLGPPCPSRSSSSLDHAYGALRSLVGVG